MSRIITLPQAEKLIQEATRSQVFHAALATMAVFVKGKAAVYPPARHEPQPFTTDKQRRGFFARLRAGEIEVPYRRGGSPGTEYMNRSWDTSASDGGWSQTVGNRASYAPLVQGKSQSFYHKQSGFKTLDAVWEENEDDALKVLFGAFKKILDNIGRVL